MSPGVECCLCKITYKVYNKSRNEYDKKGTPSQVTACTSYPGVSTISST